MNKTLGSKIMIKVIINLNGYDPNIIDPNLYIYEFQIL